MTSHHGGMADVDELADELYARTPAGFVDARTAAAAAAKAAGDPSAAAALARMRKPTVSAWLVNQLVRTAPETVAGALAVGPALRDATRAGDAAALRDLTAHRRTLLGELVRRAAEIAADQDQAFTASLQREIESTFTVAATDDSAAAELLTGRLVTPFQTDGFGLDVGPDVPAPARVHGEKESRTIAAAGRRAAPVDVPPAARKPTTRTPTASQTAEAAARAQEIAAAEQDLANARLQAADADAQLGRASAVLEEARAAEAAASAQLKVAKARVSDARADVTAATADARATDKAVAAALARLGRATKDA